MLPTNKTLTNGTGVFTATLQSPGSQTLTATDAISSTIAGVSGVNSTSSPATHFQLKGVATSTAGSSFSLTVVALNANNNTATGYTGTVIFTSTDAQAILPTKTTLTNGVGVFSATLQTAGSQTITATDSATSGITGVTSAVSVSEAALTGLSVVAPTSVVAGTPFDITASAVDQFGNTVTSFNASVQVFSSDAGASVLTGNAILNGVGTFTIQKCRPRELETISVADPLTLLIGTSPSITVVAAAASHFTVSAPSSATVGGAFTAVLTALDPFGNTAKAYSGTVHFSSSDPLAVLPADTTMTGGRGAFSVTLKTVGSQSLTATDTVTAAVKGSSSCHQRQHRHGYRYGHGGPFCRR